MPKLKKKSKVKKSSLKKKSKAKSLQTKSKSLKKKSKAKSLKTKFKKPNNKKKVTAVKKKKKVSAVQKGYHSITPYLIVKNAAQAIEFYKTAFAAREVLRMEHDGGDKIGHAELIIGDSKFMLADEYPEMDAHSPEVFGGSPVGIHLYVKNVDDVMQRALMNGAILLRAAEDMFYGDRSGALLDPFGHKWFVATHIEDLTPAQIKKRSLENKLSFE